MLQNQDKLFSFLSPKYQIIQINKKSRSSSLLLFFSYQEEVGGLFFFFFFFPVRRRGRREMDLQGRAVWELDLPIWTVDSPKF